jgi:hypothetical protein
MIVRKRHILKNMTVIIRQIFINMAVRKRQKFKNINVREIIEKYLKKNI